MKGVPVLASLPPVVLNAVVVGLELTLVSPVFTPQVLAINMLSVGIGQLLACTVCGLLLHAALERSGAAAHLFGRRALYLESGLFYKRLYKKIDLRKRPTAKCSGWPLSL